LLLDLLDSLPQHPPIVFDPVAPLGQFGQLNHLALIWVPEAMTEKRVVGRNLQGMALGDWQLRRALHQKAREELRRSWQEGIDSGPGHLADLRAIKAEARRRFAQTGASE
jgi:hypothetical protein